MEPAGVSLDNAHHICPDLINSSSRGAVLLPDTVDWDYTDKYVLGCAPSAPGIDRQLGDYGGTVGAAADTV